MNQRQMRGLLILCGAILAASAGLWAFNWIHGGHHYWVSAAAFNRDGTLLVTAAGDDHVAEIILWDVALARKVSRQKLPLGRPLWIWFSGQDRQVVLSCDMTGTSANDYRPNQIAVVDLARKSVVDSFVEPDIVGGTLPLEQTRQLVIYGRQSIELRGLADDQRATLISHREAGINAIDIAADQCHLAAACRGFARVWDLQTNTELPAFDAQGVRLAKIAVAAGGNFVAATGDEFSSRDETFELFFWDRAQGTSVTNVIRFAQPVTMLRFLPGDAPRLLVVTGKDRLDCNVSIYDAAGQQLEELYAGQTAIKALDVTRDGTHLVWVDSRGSGELWKLESPQSIRVWKKTLGELRLVRFARDTKLFAGHGWGPEVSMYDATTGTVAARFKGYQSSTLSLQLLYVLPLMLLVFGIDWFTKLRTRHRKEGMLAVARQLGWQHTSGALPDGIPEFHFFSKRQGGRFEHVLLGPGEKYDTLLAAYQWVQGSGEKKSTMYQLCVIYPHLKSDLPDIFVRPESFTDKLAEYVGFSDIDLDGSDSLQRFSSRYLLRTKAPDRMPNLISESLADFLCDHEGWNIEVVDGSVLLWWQVVKSFTTSRFTLTDPDRILEFLEESRTIVQLLVPEIAGRRR